MDAGLIACFASRLDGAAEAGEPMARPCSDPSALLVPPWSASGPLGVEGGLVHLLAQHGRVAAVRRPGRRAGRWPPARHGTCLTAASPSSARICRRTRHSRSIASTPACRAIAQSPCCRRRRGCAGRRRLHQPACPRTHAVAAAEAALLAALARIAGAMLAAERRLEAARGAGREPAAEEARPRSSPASPRQSRFSPRRRSSRLHRRALPGQRRPARPARLDAALPHRAAGRALRPRPRRRGDAQRPRRHFSTKARSMTKSPGSP